MTSLRERLELSMLPLQDAKTPHSRGTLTHTQSTLFHILGPIFKALCMSVIQENLFCLDPKLSLTLIPLAESKGQAEIGGSQV